MKPRTLLLAFLILIALTATAFADQLATGGAAELDPLVKLLLVVLTILGGVLTPIAVALGRKYAKRIDAATGIDLTDDVTAVAGAAVAFAEQLAASRLTASGLKMPGGEKMKIAASFFVDTAEKKKWPAWVQAQANAWIEAKLGDRPKLIEGTLLTTEPAK